MNIILLCFIFFLVSIVGVSTGGLSLLTVPLLIFAGLTPVQAVSTNMVGLVFISLSGAAGFRPQLKKSSFLMLFKLSAISAAASLAGARVLFSVNETLLKNIIGGAIIAVTLSLLFFRDPGLVEVKKGRVKKGIGWILIFTAGIYGGFFSGGYITILSYILIFFWGFTFLRAAAVTKVLNLFSSAAASLYFIYRGSVIFSYALPISAAMFAGGYLGARIALLKGNRWLRKIFLAAAAVLGAAMAAG